MERPKKESLLEYMEDGSKALEKLSFCGLMANGIKHEIAPLFNTAYVDAGDTIKTTLKQMEGILQAFHTILRGEEDIQCRQFSTDYLIDEVEKMIEERMNSNLHIEKNISAKISVNEVLFS